MIYEDDVKNPRSFSMRDSDSGSLTYKFSGISPYSIMLTDSETTATVTYYIGKSHYIYNSKKKIVPAWTHVTKLLSRYDHYVV